MNIEIKYFGADDWKAVANIYKLGIDTDVATFETALPSWSAWNKTHLKSGRLSAWLENKLVGWAALSPVSDRCVYGGVAEVSVYVDPAFNGKGIGKLLMLRLIDESEKEGLWTLQSGIFRENKASIQLHKKVGFRQIGYREKIGKRNGRWHDNILMERRSNNVGIN